MSSLNRNLPPVPAGQFSMVPRMDIPRSVFATKHALKTTLQTGYLVPIHVDEVLPGDVHQGELTVFARLATPLFPLMDNVYVETFFFFVPCRLLWDNWVKMMGERRNPSDSISYTIPQVSSPAGGFAVCSLADYFGLPTVGQVTAGQDVSVNALPFRAYNLVFNEWFRDQNLQSEQAFLKGDGPDALGSYVLMRRNKRHDYFTSCLPWPTKNNEGLAAPLTGVIGVKGIAAHQTNAWVAGNPAGQVEYGVGAPNWSGHYVTNGGNVSIQLIGSSGNHSPGLTVDLSSATGLLLESLRLAVATRQLLERDARSGTRYTELLQAHFGVRPEDSRLQRPEYIGGGKTPMSTQAIPQTSNAGLTGNNAPLGSLGGASVGSGEHRFSYYATEHGYIIGLANVSADVTYQQGLHRLWTRLTRFDIYWPEFANLGEQAVLRSELYCTGDPTVDAIPFGYQERWAEYRHRPSRITGMFRSTTASNIDEWHLSQQFGSPPTLNVAFMEDNLPFSRVIAAGAAADNQQVLWDSVFKIRCTRPLPQYSVPGLMRF